MKKLAALLIGLVVVLTGISLAPQFLLNQAQLRQRIITAFHHQTGLELKMGGTSFQLLPWPSFQATNVVLTRPGCTPFVAARSVHADISLLALLNREISFQNFTVEGAGMTLHRASEGQCATWLPILSQQPVPLVAPQGEMGRISPHWKVSFGALHLSDADLSWQNDGENGPKGPDAHIHEDHIHIASLEVEGMRSTSPWVDIHGTHAHTAFTLRGRLGPLARLFSAKAAQGAPWAFSLGATLGEGQTQDHVTLDGTMRDAHRLRGVSLSLEGQWADLHEIQLLFPQLSLPDMGQLEGTIRLHSEDEPLSQEVTSSHEADMALANGLLHLPYRLVPDQFHIHIGHVALPAGTWHSTAPLQLSDVQLDADAGQAPVTLQGQIVWGRYMWLVHTQLESLQQSLAVGLAKSTAPLGAKIEIYGQDKTLANLFHHDDAAHGSAAQDHVAVTVQGTLGRMGSALDVDGHADLLQLPEGGALSGLLVHGGRVKGHVTLGPLSEQGWPSLQLHNMTVESQELGGEITADLASPLVAGVTASVHITHMDTGRFQYAPVATMPAGPAAPSVSSSGAPSVQEEGAHQAVEPMWAKGLGPMVPWLGQAAAMPLDIDVIADALHVEDIAYEGLHLHVFNHEGQMKLAVLGGKVQTVPLSGAFSLDGSVEPVRLSFRAAPLIIPASWLQQAFNQPMTFSGPVQLDGELATMGAHPGALLQTLGGHMGLSLVDGHVHREVLAPLAGPAASLLKLGSGTMALRCLAMTTEFDHGQVHFGTMALEVKHLAVTGQGVMQLDDGHYHLDLLPHVSVVGMDFSTPLQVEGQGRAFHIGALKGADQPHSSMDQAGAGGGDICAHALQQARDGQPGLPLPGQEKSHSGGAESILRALGIGN